MGAPGAEAAAFPASPSPSRAGAGSAPKSKCGALLVVNEVLASDAGSKAGGIALDLLRQRTIVNLLRLLHMPVEDLCSAVQSLMRTGVLTHDVNSDLKNLADGAACRKEESLVQAPSTPCGAFGAALRPPPPPSHFEQHFERLELIGKGAFGEVWRCRHRVDGREYAVKQVRYELREDGGLTRARVVREVEMLAKLKHANAVHYHTAWIEEETEEERAPAAAAGGAYAPPALPPAPPAEERRFDSYDGGYSDCASEGGVVFEASEASPPPAAEAVALPAPVMFQQGGEIVPWRLPKQQRCAKLYIQMELCSGETLQRWIGRRNEAMANPTATVEERLEWAHEAARIVSQCADVVSYLHAKGVAHRDIKPANIFFAQDGNIRLGDFGLAKVMQCTDMPPTLEDEGPPFANPLVPSHTVGLGTPSYSSPEQIAHGNYGVQTDIYALGVVFAELLCPVGTQMERADLMEALRGRRGRATQACRLPANTAADFPELAALVLAMTKHDAAARPSAKTLVDALPAALAATARKLQAPAMDTCSRTSVENDPSEAFSPHLFYAQKRSMPEDASLSARVFARKP